MKDITRKKDGKNRDRKITKNKREKKPERKV